VKYIIQENWVEGAYYEEYIRGIVQLRQGFR